MTKFKRKNKKGEMQGKQGGRKEGRKEGMKEGRKEGDLGGRKVSVTGNGCENTRIKYKVVLFVFKSIHKFSKKSMFICFVYVLCCIRLCINT